MSRSSDPKKAWFVVFALASIAVLARVVNWFRGGDSASANVPADADEPPTDVFWTEWNEIKIKELSEKAQIEHRGNLRIKGSILKGMKITVIDGDVEIDGDLQDGSQLTVKKTIKENRIHSGQGSNAYVNNTVRVSGNYNSNVGNVIGVNNSVNIVGFFGFFRWLFGSSVHVNSGTKHTTIKIHGNLLENSKINAENADVHVSDIHNHASVYADNGSVTAKNILDKTIEMANSNIQVIETANGEIKVNSLGINSKIKTSNGKISVIENVAAAASIETVNGDIVIGGNVGESATLSTVNGDMSVKGDVSEAAVMRTTSGDVIVNGTVHKSAEISSVNGDFIVKGNVDEKANLHTGNGDIEISGNKHENAILKTELGEITVRGIKLVR